MNITADVVRDALWMCTPTDEIYFDCGPVLLVSNIYFQPWSYKWNFSLFFPFWKNCCIWQAKENANQQTSAQWRRKAFSRCTNNLFRGVSCHPQPLASKNDWFLLVGKLLQVNTHLLLFVIKTDQSMFKWVLSKPCLCFLWHELNGFLSITNIIQYM